MTWQNIMSANYTNPVVKKCLPQQKKKKKKKKCQLSNILVCQKSADSAMRWSAKSANSAIHGSAKSCRLSKKMLSNACTHVPHTIQIVFTYYTLCTCTSDAHVLIVTVAGTGVDGLVDTVPQNVAGFAAKDAGSPNLPSAVWSLRGLQGSGIFTKVNNNKQQQQQQQQQLMTLSLV